MSRGWSYEVDLRREGGEVHAYCDEVPEAIASGATEDAARREMSEALIAAVRGRMKDGMDLPPPPTGASDRLTIALPVQLAAKAALYAAWRVSGLSAGALGDRIGHDEAEVRHVLDPDHATGLDRLAEAAAGLGGRLAVTFEAA